MRYIQLLKVYHTILAHWERVKFHNTKETKVIRWRLECAWNDLMQLDKPVLEE